MYVAVSVAVSCRGCLLCMLAVPQPTGGEPRGCARELIVDCLSGQLSLVCVHASLRISRESLVSPSMNVPMMQTAVATESVALMGAG